VIAGLGVVTLLTVGAVAVQALVGGGGDGANSPEAAVARLVDAVAAEDPVAAVAALAPDEVQSLGDLVTEIEDRAQDEGLAAEGDTFAGIDLTADDMEYEVDELGDGVARVTITDGTLGYSFDPDQLSEQSRRLVDAGDSEGELDISDEAGGFGEDAFLVAVRRGGSWYVSLAYTLAEYVVDGLDLPEADFDAEPDLRDPAPDPEAAVIDLVEALGQGDAREIAAGLPEDEWRVLVPYEDALSELLEGSDGEGLDADLEVTEAALDVQDLGDGARRVKILSAEGTVEGSDGEEIEWELDGWCFRTSGDEELWDELCDAVEGSYLARTVQDEAPSVVVVEDRGGWVVSPVRTVLDSVRAALPDLDHDIIVTMLGRPDLVAPDGEAPFGEAFEVELGSAGVATRTITAAADAELIVTVDDSTWWYLVDQDGDELDYGDDGYLVEEGREYLLVLQRQERAGAAPVTVTVGQVVHEDLGEVSLSGTVDGTLSAAGPVRRSTFTLDREVSAEIEVDGAAFVEIYEDGEYVCEGGDVCDFLPGSEYTLVMRGEEYDLHDGAEVDVSVSFTPIEPPPPGTALDATIDGGPAVNGELESGESAFHDLLIPAGVSVVVSVVADVEGDEEDVDFDAYVEDEEFTESGDEEFVLEGPLDAEIEVYLYTDEPAGYVVLLSPA
jgi:hypothetical protein